MPHPALVDDLFDEFLDRLREGQRVQEAWSGTGMSQSVLYRRMRAKPEMWERFAAARQQGAVARGEKYVDKADEIAMDDDNPKQWNALSKLLEAYVPEFKRTTVVEHQGAPVWIGMSEVVDAEYEELDSGDAPGLPAGTQEP